MTSLCYLGGKTPDPHSKARGYAEIMGETNLKNAKVCSKCRIDLETVGKSFVFDEFRLKCDNR